MEKNKQEWYEFAHGSPNVMGGRLTAQTDTDYLIFRCPRCEQGMLVIDYGIKYDQEFKGWSENTPSGIPEPKRTFAVVFEIYCGQCDEWDVVKITYGRLGPLEKSQESIGKHFEHPGRWWRSSNEEGN